MSWGTRSIKYHLQCHVQLFAAVVRYSHIRAPPDESKDLLHLPGRLTVRNLMKLRHTPDNQQLFSVASTILILHTCPWVCLRKLVHQIPLPIQRLFSQYLRPWGTRRELTSVRDLKTLTIYQQVYTNLLPVKLFQHYAFSSPGTPDTPSRNPVWETQPYSINTPHSSITHNRKSQQLTAPLINTPQISTV